MLVDPNGLRDSREPRAQAADASDHELDRDAALRRPVQRVDDRRLDERIHLHDDPRGAALARVALLALDQPMTLLAHADGPTPAFSSGSLRRCREQVEQGARVLPMSDPRLTSTSRPATTIRPPAGVHGPGLFTANPDMGRTRAPCSTCSRQRRRLPLEKAGGRARRHARADHRPDRARGAQRAPGPRRADHREDECARRAVASSTRCTGRRKAARRDRARGPRHLLPAPWAPGVSETIRVTSIVDNTSSTAAFSTSKTAAIPRSSSRAPTGCRATSWRRIRTLFPIGRCSAPGADVGASCTHPCTTTVRCRELLPTALPPAHARGGRGTLAVQVALQNLGARPPARARDRPPTFVPIVRRPSLRTFARRCPRPPEPLVACASSSSGTPSPKIVRGSHARTRTTRSGPSRRRDGTRWSGRPRLRRSFPSRCLGCKPLQARFETAEIIASAYGDLTVDRWRAHAGRERGPRVAWLTGRHARGSVAVVATTRFQPTGLHTARRHEQAVPGAPQGRGLSARVPGPVGRGAATLDWFSRSEHLGCSAPRHD